MGQSSKNRTQLQVLCPETLPGHSCGHEYPEQRSKGPHPGQGTQRAWGTQRTTHAYFLNSEDMETHRGQHRRGWGENKEKIHQKERKDEWLKAKVKVARSCPTFCNPMDCPWNSPGQNTRVGSLSLLRGIFPTQGLNPGFPHCRQILHQLSHKGSPRILEWVAYSFSSRSSQHQELNRGLLHCRQTLYQLSYQGSPEWFKIKNNLTLNINMGLSRPQMPRWSPASWNSLGWNPNLTQLMGKSELVHACMCGFVGVPVCVHIWVQMVGRLDFQIPSQPIITTYVHFSSLPDKVQNCVHLISPTFENVTMELKVSDAFWLNIVLGNDCFTYFFLPPLNCWLLSDIRAPLALIKLVSLQNS